MSDLADDFRFMRDYSRALRARYGEDCPGCIRTQPKRIPTCMLPGQRCKVCGYRDPRPRLTQAQIDEATASL